MKTRKLLLVLPLSLVALVSCNNGDSSTSIKLFDANSRLIGTPKPDPNNPTQPLPMLEENILIEKLPTYHHSKKGDVPYVEVSEFARAVDATLSTLVAPGFITENKEDGYHLYTLDKKGEFIIDANKDIIKVKNTQSFVSPVLVTNNGLAGDYCNYRGKSIKESEKTKQYMEDGSAVNEYDTFDFGKYNFDIVSDKNNCYVPLEAFTKILFRDVGLDLAYNGKDFYSNLSDSGFLASLVYSSNGYFQGLSGLYQPSKEKATGIAYQFEFATKKLKEGSDKEMEDYTKYLVLNEGGTGYSMLCKGNKLDPSAATSDVESEYTYTWKKEGEMLKVEVSDNVGGLGTYQIHLDQTRFLSSKISNELSKYNYDVVRFVFDTNYGLKDIKGYKDAVEFFKQAGVDEGLKSNIPDEYNKAFAKLIGYVDDGHSSFNNMTPISSFSDLDKLKEYTEYSLGPRVRNLAELSRKYKKARMDKAKELSPDDANPEDPNFYQGIKFSKDKETAIISFNGFANNAPEIQNMAELFPEGLDIEEENYNIITRANLITSTTKGFATAFKVLDLVNKNSKVVKNVVFDLTINGGGEIATLPFLSAFFSDDPIYTIKDSYNGAIKEYHYKVDLNGDGKFGDADDTYKGKFNFYFLTSGFSFSCGNCLPGLGKDAGAKIIGETSGGGTSPVGVFYDGIGTFFNLSSHYDMCYKVNGKYTQNDSGIALDHSFPFDNGNWYDPNAVDNFIKSL